MEIKQDLVKVRNFTKGRDGQQILALVIHIMEGSLKGTDNWFDNDESDVSAHYGVGKDGTVIQWVRDEDQAWHAGIKKDPTVKVVRDKGAINPNAYTIGIEFEGFAADGDPGTPEQLQAGAELIAHLCSKYRIPVTDEYIIPHRSIRASKTCPGDLNYTFMIAQARTVVASEVHPADRITERRAIIGRIEAELRRLKEIS